MSTGVEELPPETEGSAIAAGPFGVRWPSAIELVGLSFLLIQFVAYSPWSLIPHWTFRYALALGVIPIGVVLVGRLALRRDHAAMAAAGFLLAAAMSTALSSSPLISLFGAWGDTASLVMYVGAFGAWALGRQLSAASQGWTYAILIGGASLNAVYGVIQVVWHIRGGPLAAPSGRATGFLGNPIYFGAAVSGVAVACAVHYLRSPRVAWLLGAGALAFAGGLSGSRSSYGSVLLVSVGLLAVAAVKVRAAVWSAVSLIAGLAASSLFSRAFSGTDTTTRVASGNGGGRELVWSYAWRAFLERPVFGWGLGRHPEATRPFYSMDFTRDYAYDEQNIVWQHPHNAVLHLLVTVGIVGCVLALVFVVVSLRNVRDPALVLMVAVIATTWMLQPVSLPTLSITLLAFGAATGLQPDVDRWAPLSKRALVLVCGAGAVLGAYVLTWEYIVVHTAEGGNFAAAERALEWNWGDPFLTSEVGRLVLVEWERGRVPVDDVLDWAERPTEIDPSSSLYWADLGRRRLAVGEYESAREAAERALELYPWSPTSWQVVYISASLSGDDQAAQTAEAVVCHLRLPLCPTDE